MNSMEEDTMVGIDAFAEANGVRMVTGGGGSTSPLRAYINSMSGITRLSDDEQWALWAEGTVEARQRVVQCYLPLVMGMVSRWMGGFAGRDDAEVLDLIGAGNLGLWKAASRFDPSLGNKFITYATYWVRAEIAQQAAASRNGAGLPPVDAIPTLEEGGEDTLWWGGNQPYQGTVRLDALMEDGTRRDFADRSEPSPEEVYEKAEAKEIVEMAIASRLSPKERFVIEACYGLGEFRKTGRVSPRVVGVALAERGFCKSAVTRQAVDLIRKRAEGKLRKDPRIAELL